ncbi:nucleotidyltransferase [Priestia flexa]|uniref:nucleotidyltransferase n=1 Tax=Priestia flexa TaxID=86664 RepID=UPI0010FC3507|nr:nucleotidyltransferase [Priestia flexa]QCS52156.1 nucleotidyltransferase [Priestia flexa]
MQAVGIIVEYNPFHNGHHYHLQSAKEETNADCVIAVMSGHFLQRGEPAVVSKWARTKMALKAGADLVIELPYAFSTQQADTFANGAVAILEHLKASYVCFGSEHGNTQSFLKFSRLLKEHEHAIDEHVQSYLKVGNSYPKALSLAMKNITNEQIGLNIEQPNNILGVSYVKAIEKQHASIKPHTITRIQSHYHDKMLSETEITSATSIRHALFQDIIDVKDLSRYMPNPVIQGLKDYQTQIGFLHNWELYFPFLKYQLMTHSPESLQAIYEIEEGIEYRLLNAIKEALSFEDFLSKVKTKRYTRTRLQRMCVHILTNTKKNELSKSPSTAYIRLLGISQIGRLYMKQIKKDVSVPIVSTVSQCKHVDLSLDIKATNIYSSPLQEPIRSQFLKQEYTQPPIMI